MFTLTPNGVPYSIINMYVYIFILLAHVADYYYNNTCYTCAILNIYASK